MNKGLMNLVVKAVDNATPTLRKIGKGFGSLKKAGTAVGSGLQTAALGAVGIATAVAGFTIAATAAAAEEEKQVARLNGVLKTRGMLTDQNSAAVEEQTAKMENLAFADDQVRESLITATAFTKNFNDALKIQNVAADVAAAKGISLEEATSLVGKAYQGNTKGLKGLGVEVKKGAKGIAALDAVTAKYKGSAEAAANTVSGKFTKAQIKMGNIMENFGAAFLPIASDGLSILSDTVLPAVAKGLEDLKPVLSAVGNFITKTLVPAVGGFINKLTAPGGVIESVMKVVGPIINSLIPVFGQIFDAVGKTGAKISELVGILWGDGKGPLAVGVQAVGNILGFVGKIIANLIGFVGEAIGAVINVSKAIMDSPIGWVIQQIAGIIGGVAGGVGGALGITPAANAGTGVSANPMDAKYTINIGGKDVDGVVKDSLGRIVTTTTPGR
jgi:phage-related protein